MTVGIIHRFVNGNGTWVWELEHTNKTFSDLYCVVHSFVFIDSYCHGYYRIIHTRFGFAPNVVVVACPPSIARFYLQSVHHPPRDEVQTMLLSVYLKTSSADSIVHNWWSREELFDLYKNFNYRSFLFIDSTNIWFINTLLKLRLWIGNSIKLKVLLLFLFARQRLN